MRHGRHGPASAARACALTAVLALGTAASCSSDGSSGDDVASGTTSTSPRAEETRPPDGLREALDGHRDCPPECAAFEDRLETTRAVRSAAADLDRANVASGDTKSPLALAVASFVSSHASLRTCTELSSQKHSGPPQEGDCRTAIEEFDRAFDELEREAGGPRSPSGQSVE